MSIKKRLLLLPPVAVGVVVLILLMRNRSGPVRTQVVEAARAVQILTIKPRPVRPTLVGYGTVAPGRTWRAVAEISARVKSRAKHLAEGQFFAAGDELLQLDDNEVKLEVARLTAEVAALKAQQDRLGAGIVNDTAMLVLERESLVLAEAETARLASLRGTKRVTQTEVDAQARQVLAQKAVVLRLESSLRLAPFEQLVLVAQVASTTARLEQAKLDVGRTRIEVPFACRIAAVHIERSQPVTPGTVLVEVDGVATAEVTAHVALQHLRPLIRKSSDGGFPGAIADPTFWSRLGLEATIQLRGEGLETTWPARFTRIAHMVDPKTRTAGLVVSVDNPYGQARPGIRPPLVKGMYVQVTFRGQPREGCIMIPRSAVHQGQVRVLDQASRLKLRHVEVDFVVGDEVCISKGLTEGDRLILTDLVPAIEGMLLEVR